MKSAFNLDETLIALADATRRAILERLSGGEARVTDLAQPFAMSLNSVSKHIAMLERARLVHRRRAGREHFLSLNPAPLEEAARWIVSHRTIWMARLDDAAPHAPVRGVRQTERGRPRRGAP